MRERSARQKTINEILFSAAIRFISGKKSEVEIILDKRSFSSWNEADRNWEVRSGSYEILIGSSAEKILLQTTIDL